MSTLILILIIILCIVIAAGLIKTKVIEYTTFNYKSDFVADEKGFIWLEVNHKGVKPESFKLKFDNISGVYDQLKEHRTIIIKCYVSPLFSQARIKEIWVRGHRIK